ncbi:hypothetical protein [Aquimarina sp. AU474]|uniref:hypothetical protein n=1 Tax=Aquimarina sp. AU474 TaxID=2108529 RepID=UPI000D69BADE|nr:hypothetical protein [Aquimarina sp. AU474]
MPQYSYQHTQVFKIIVITFFVSLLPWVSLLAQQTEKEAMAKLSFMVGNWKGPSTSFKNDTQNSVTVLEEVKYIMDGNLLVLNLNSPNLQLHTVINYSIKDSTYYYQPFSKKGAGKYKGKIESNQFIVYFNDQRRLVFEKTKNAEFHEYGEKLVNNRWEKYFEDILKQLPKKD